MTARWIVAGALMGGTLLGGCGPAPPPEHQGAIERRIGREEE